MTVSDPANAGRADGTAYPGAITAAATLVFAILAMLVEQAGVPRHYAFVMTGALLVVGIAIPGLQMRTMSVAEWTVAGRGVGRAAGVLSLGASLLAGWTLITLGGQFFARSAAAPAWIIGPLLGLALGAILIAPFLRKSGAATPARFVALRFDSRAVTLVFAAAGVLAGLLLVWAQLKFAAAMASAMWGLDATTAMVAAAAVCGLSVVPGGARGVIRVNGLVFVFLATAYLAPLVWLSLSLSRFPLPQLAYGYGALADVGAVEAQLQGLAIPLLAERVNGLLPAGAGAVEVAMLALFLAAGLCAMPFVLGHFAAASRLSGVRPAAGWAILALAFVLAAAPALGAFAKLGLYNNLLGLTVGEVAAGADWLMSWGALPSLDGAGTMATLCGLAIPDPGAAIAACGGGPEYVIGPADLSLTPEIVTLAFAQIVGLPSVAGALIGAAALAASVAGANAALIQVAVSASRDFARPGRSAPASRVLFTGRLAALAALAAAVLLALKVEAGSMALFMWAVAIAACVLMPVLLAAVWWDRAGWRAALAGMLSGALVLAVHAGLAFLGPDLRPGSGDEIVVLVPGLASLPPAVHAAVLALPVAIAAMAAAAMVRHPPADEALLASIREPAGEAPIRDPEF